MAITIKGAGKVNIITSNGYTNNTPAPKTTVETPKTSTDDFWATLKAEASARQETAQERHEATKGQIAAKFAGKCGRTGRRYSKGTMIERTRYGWAIVGTTDQDEDFLPHQMAREDSAF